MRTVIIIISGVSDSVVAYLFDMPEVIDSESMVVNDVECNYLTLSFGERSLL